MFFKTAKSFKDTLVGLLQPYLGTVTLTGGSVHSAVFVGEPPLGVNIQGLALSLPKLFNSESEPLTGGAGITNELEFTLVQHPGSNHLEAATNIVMRSLTPITCRYMPAARDPSGAEITLDHCVFSLSRSGFWLK